MNNYRKGLKKRRKKELWRDQREPIDQKRFEVAEKGCHCLKRRRKMHTKNKRKTKITAFDR